MPIRFESSSPTRPTRSRTITRSFRYFDFNTGGSALYVKFKLALMINKSNIFTGCREDGTAAGSGTRDVTGSEVNRFHRYAMAIMRARITRPREKDLPLRLQSLLFSFIPP